jgi:LPS-assembly lipoprotein
MAALLGGCGFRPAYLPESGSAVPELAAVRVGNIPERFGQLIRRDLQRRLDLGGSGAQARYLLDALVTVNIDSVGFRRDGTITRQRYTAIGTWALSTLSVPPERLGGSAIPVRTIDSYNIPDLQFFAADSAREAMERRLAEVVSEEIIRQVVLVLRQRGTTA